MSKLTWLVAAVVVVVAAFLFTRNLFPDRFAKYKSAEYKKQYTEFDFIIIGA